MDLSNKHQTPPSASASARQPHKKSKSQGSPRSLMMLNGNSSSGNLAPKRNSMHAALTHAALGSNVSNSSQNYAIKASYAAVVKSPVSTTSSAFFPPPSSPKSFATSNTATTATSITQSSAIFSSSFFSASTSHLDEDLTSQLGSTTSSSTRLPFLRGQQQQQEPQSTQTLHALDLDQSHSSSLHAHRQSHNSSKLPTFRIADFNGGKPPMVPLPSLLQNTPTASPAPQGSAVSLPPSTAVTRSSAAKSVKNHRRGKSENIPPKPPALLKSATAPVGVTAVEAKASPAIVTSISASASSPSLPLSSSFSSTPHKVPSAIKRPRDSLPSSGLSQTHFPPQSQTPSQSQSQSQSHSHSQSHSSQSQVQTPTGQEKTGQSSKKSQTQKAQAQSQTSQSRPGSSQTSRVRSSTSAIDGPKQPAPILVVSKRPASFPTSPRAQQVTFVEPATDETVVTVAKGANQGANRRSFVPSSSTGTGAGTGSSTSTKSPPISIRSQRVQAAVEAASANNASANASANSSASTANPASTKTEQASLPSKSDRASSRERLATLQKSSTLDEKRISLSRPPVSLKPRPSSPSTVSSAGSNSGIRVPPIRAFRSSVARRSLTVDTAAAIALSTTENDQDTPENTANTSTNTNTNAVTTDATTALTSRQKALRLLEGRIEDSIPQIMTPVESPGHDDEFADVGADPEDTCDVFLKIAREENGRTSSAAAHDDAGFFSDDNQSRNQANRVGRSAHRRPLSSVIPSHAAPQSPTRVARRLSDQQETSRSRVRGGDDAHSTAGPPRTLNYRSLARDLSSAASAVGVGEEVGRRAPVTRSHTSAGSRSLVLQDSTPTDGPQYTSRRKPSISEGISIVTSARSGNLKAGTSYHPRAYHSSPLASRNNSEQIILTSQTIQQPSSHQSQQESQAQEGTDSTTSTGPPGTVWDELDDLKSRIHRLELTGKLPNSSSSAMSRVSDDRPPTAHTAATTNSGSSPKRPTTNGVLSAAGSHNADNTSTTSSQKEGHSLLHTALNQAKAGVSSEVYRALELAANDALGLTMMMGTVGQPGPISSGASAIGFGGVSTITDRQLRRRAEGVVRGLTELCIALSSESSQRPSSNTASPSVETAQEPPMSPTSGKTFASILQRRQQNVVVEQNAATVPSSPRAISKFEERRNKLLNSPSLATNPRYSATSPSGPPPTMPPPAPEIQPPMTAGRKSSMLLARRRTANDEAEESSGRKTSMLRTRRGGGGGDETDDGGAGAGRRTSMLFRGRRAAAGVTSDDDEPRLRAPSRAITEVVPPRPGTRGGGDYAAAAASAQSGDGSGAAGSGPRRRMASALASRLGGVPPQAGVPTPRRFLERQATERDSGLSVIEKVQSEERLQRPMSLGQAMLGRTPSLNRRATRER